MSPERDLAGPTATIRYSSDKRRAHFLVITRRWMVAHAGKAPLRGAQMRLLIALFALCVAGSGFAADAVQIDRVELTEYGILTHTGRTRIGVGSSGIPHDMTHGTHIEATTNIIPACLGTGFGARFRIVGAPSGALADIVAVWRFPQPGLAVPGRAEPVLADEFADRPRVGSQIYRSYEFDSPWELALGTWTLEIRNKDRLLASHDFTVVRPPEHRCDGPMS